MTSVFTSRIRTRPPSASAASATICCSGLRAPHAVVSNARTSHAMRVMGPECTINVARPFDFAQGRANMTTPSVHVSGLHKSYGAFAAVKGIDFDIHPGEVFGLLGPNGAGKTTTVEILEGLRA